MSQDRSCLSYLSHAQSLAVTAHGKCGLSVTEVVNFRVWPLVNYSPRAWRAVRCIFMATTLGCIHTELVPKPDRSLTPICEEFS